MTNREPCQLKGQTTCLVNASGEWNSSQPIILILCPQHGRTGSTKECEHDHADSTFETFSVNTMKIGSLCRSILNN